MEYYQTWQAEELRWTEELRRQCRHRLKKAALLFFLPFLGGAAAITPIMSLQGSLSDPAEGLAYGLLLLCFGLFLMLLIFPFLLRQTAKGFYVRRLRKMAGKRGLTPEDLEDLGRDLLEAANDPRRRFEFADSAQKGSPFHFLLGRRWAFLSGGWDYSQHT